MGLLNRRGMSARSATIPVVRGDMCGVGDKMILGVDGSVDRGHG